MNKIIFSCFIILFSKFVFSQNELQVHYSILMNKNYTDIDGFSAEEKKISKIIFEAENLVSYTLISNKNESVFFNDEIMFSDDHNSLFKAIINRNKSYVYHDNRLDKSFKKINFSEKDYLIYEQPVKWVITNESKEIHNYLCYKAFLDIKINDYVYKIIVWFSPEIPFKIGPKNAINLPGLVLEYQEGGLSIVAKSIKHKIDNNLIEKLKKPNGIEISKENFDKLLIK